MNTRDIEDRLKAYTPARPDAALRKRVLDGTLRKQQRPVSASVLRWALAGLVVTLIWARFQEARIAERMAQAARAPMVRMTAEAPRNTVTPVEKHPDDELGFFTARFLHPRVRLPLPEGYPYTRLYLSPTSAVFERNPTTS